MYKKNCQNVIAALLVSLGPGLCVTRLRFVSILIISPYFPCLITWLLRSTLHTKGLFPGARATLISAGKPAGCVAWGRRKDSTYGSGGLRSLNSTAICRCKWTVTAPRVESWHLGVEHLRFFSTSTCLKHSEQQQ